MFGVAALIFGMQMRLSQSVDEAQPAPISTLHPLATFGFGMVVMLNEMTTALPYLVALEQIAAAKLPLPENLLLLVSYNLIFSVPLFCFLGLFLYMQDQFAERVTYWSRLIQHWTPRLIKAASIGFGCLLILNVLTFVMRQQALF